uniref:aralkylamine N-acetyltransferase n=1 Tax=Glossina austeni TaxID=7395 RepID=A0A1A9VWQ7_GLOAU
MFSLGNLKRFNFGISLTIRYFAGSKSSKLKLEYRDISREYYPAVLKHLTHNFFVNEPLMLTMAPTLKCSEFMAYADKDTLDMLGENFSVMAVNGNNEIAGVAINHKVSSGDFQDARDQLHTINDENYRKLLKLLYDYTLEANIFECFQIDEYFELHMLSVDGKFRGEGIGKHLINDSENMAKKHGFKLMKSDATGAFSQKLFKSAGFEVVHEVLYNEYVDSNNKPIFPVAPPHTKLQLVCKCLD